MTTGQGLLRGCEPVVAVSADAAMAGAVAVVAGAVAAVADAVAAVP